MVNLFNSARKRMRITWIILASMLVIGTIMFFLANRREPPGKYHTLRVLNTTDSVIKKIKIYAAMDPVELHFTNNNWYLKDSTTLPLILDGRPLNYIDKHVQYSTLYITYSGHFFYDLDLIPPSPGETYSLAIKVEEKFDSVFVSGIYDNHTNNLIQFRMPMMKMYADFLLTYNKRLEGNLADSLFVDKDPRTTKTITIFTY